MTSRTAVSLATLPLALLALAACGGGGSGASTSVPPTSSAAPAPSSSSAPFPADAEFVTNECGVPGGNPTAAAAAPDGVTVSGVTVTETAVPSIDVKKGLPPSEMLQKVTMAEGSGKAAKATSVVTVDYCLVGQESRTMIDSSWARGEPLQIGLNQVIPGWTQGVTGMKVGERAVLVIPGDLGYGPNPPEGSGILPNETLIFVVDLLDVA
jgi:peptidylprolyl isomerase